MELLVKTVILALIFALACLVSFICAAMNFSIANYKFRKLSSNSKDTQPLKKLGNYFLRNSKRVAPITFIAAKASSAISISALFLIIFAAFGDSMAWWADMLVALCVVAVVCVFQYIFCELPAMSLAAKKPETLITTLSGPFSAIYALVLPLEFFAGKISSKFFGKDFMSGVGEFDYTHVEAAMRSVSEDTDCLPQYSYKIIKNATILPELDASDIMLPRNRVKFLDVSLGLEENLKLAREGGHSRYPLCKDNLDNCLGVVHIKDIFIGAEKTLDLDAIKHPAIRFKESEALVNVLPKLLKQEQHMAFVEDEFGGIIGVLTLDDILEEIVGEIKDEFDDDADKMISEISKDIYRVLGLAPLHKVEEYFGVDFETDDASTFGGLITSALGRFPNEKERIYFEKQHLRVTIEKVGKKRIHECTVKIENTE